jgi:catechol 2,3-dioxygenase-like lactoylglutathione lyase family enzyme
MQTTEPTTRVGVSRLGHIGLYARDLEALRDFYRDVLGLKVADQDLDRGIVFMSTDPDAEHHELALARGRATDDSVDMVQQVSWHVDSVEALQGFHRLFKEQGVRIQREVTHGNALSIYFFDPEGNRNEVYFSTGVPTPQPFSKEIDLDLPKDELLAENLRIIAAR